MLKDIIAYLPADDRAKAIIDCAISLALRFDTHLDGIAVAGGMADREIPIGATSAALELVLQYEAGIKRCTSVLRLFELAAKEAGVAYDTKAVCDAHDVIDPKLLQISRLYDLSIVVQPKSSNARLDHAMCEAVLFDSGRPMLMVPALYRGPFDLSHVSICWDGGRRAARAVHAALPFLQQAGTIDIVAVNESDRNSATSCDALATHLARHRLNVRIQRLEADRSNVHTAILLAAANAASCLLVMGGHGYAKYKDFVLGEVTCGIFKAMTIPAFVSN